MRLFGHRERPPAEALAPLARDERVVSWATAVDGGAVLATPLGLWLPGAAERIPWHLVDKATWRDGALTVVAAEDAGAGVLDELPPRSVRIAVPRDLPQTVRVRVERTIVSTRHYRLPDGGGVRVVGRRVPGRDGVTWQQVFDRDVDRDDPTVRGFATEMVEQSRSLLGL
ncbi:MAG: hypothetical protein ACJ73E_15715 [Mycobacteriales bacterium]